MNIKKKFEDILTTTFAIVLGLVGGLFLAAILSAILPPLCPGCNEKIRQGTSSCPHCHIALRWG